MIDLTDVVCNSVTCFECNGNLVYKNKRLICKRCSREFSLENHLIEFDNPVFKTQYGIQFKEEADKYEEIHSLDEDFGKSVSREVMDALSNYIALPVQSALELGCGTGILTRGFAFNGIAKYILATDISREMLAVAAQRDKSKNVVYFVQNVHKLNIRDNSFDVILGAAILHHLLNLTDALSEIYRVLKNNGAAVFVEPFYYGIQFQAFLAQTVYSFLELQKYPSEYLDILKIAIDTYSSSIQFIHENRDKVENLADLDDKHFFIKEEFVSLARDAGFGRVDFVPPWCVNSGKPPEGTKVWKEITIQNMETFRIQAGLKEIDINYSKIPFLSMIDDTIGNNLLKFISPQELIILQK